MGIKTILLKKKLEKNASPMELFVAQNLYSIMEELVRAEHADNSARLRQELADFTADFYTRFKNMASEVQQAVKADTEDSKNKAVEAISSMLVELRSFKTDCLTLIEQRNRDINSEITAKVAKITNNLESFRGPQGIQGQPGKAGKNGSPDTAEEVVAKVNKAGGVKISAIEGLTDALKSVKKLGGGKTGGGMGNVQHETKSVGSATTSVTTTYSVAAEGRAAWLYYQGQFLVYGTHYTISGRTVTLLFTPVDSTFIDITYIRG